MSQKVQRPWRPQNTTDPNSPNNPNNPNIWTSWTSWTPPLEKKRHGSECDSRCFGPATEMMCFHLLSSKFNKNVDLCLFTSIIFVDIKTSSCLGVFVFFFLSRPWLHKQQDMFWESGPLQTVISSSMVQICVVFVRRLWTEKVRVNVTSIDSFPLSCRNQQTTTRTSVVSKQNVDLFLMTAEYVLNTSRSMWGGKCPRSKASRVCRILLKRKYECETWIYSWHWSFSKRLRQSCLLTNSAKIMGIPLSGLKVKNQNTS